ncbi:MAG: DUF2829 domain-containing protein [Archangium sp.]
MNFGQALEALKQGQKVARRGWNGKGMWLALQVPDQHSRMSLPYIYMKSADDKLVPWLASQTDVLADDWEQLAAERAEQPATFNCPRRVEDGRGPGSPFAKSDAALLDHWREAGTCSYCGSMQPEAVLKKASDGVELTPTDKNYKLYVGGAKFYFQHFSKEQCIAFIELLNAKKLKLAFPGHFYAKPFFIA